MVLIRVLLAVPQPLLDTLRQVLAGAPDIEVAECPTDAIEILLAAGNRRPDVIVLMMRGEEMPGIATHLVGEHPEVRVLGVAPDASRAALYALRPQLVPLDKITPTAIVAAIRTAVREAATD